MSYIHWLRQRVGSRKIFLVYASVVLQDGSGRVLLQHRTDFKAWGLPGGALEPEEDIVSCARRELAEETGLTAGPLRLVGIYEDPCYEVTYPNGHEVQQFTVCFTGRVNGGLMRADGVESSEQQFVAPAGLPDRPILTWYLDMIGDALANREPTLRPPFRRPQTLDQIAQIRPFIGNDLLIGVGASVCVVGDNGYLLMVRRRDNGAWVFPAGFQEIGENLNHTAIREVKEETGLDIIPNRFIGLYSSPLYHHTYSNGHQVKNVGVFIRARLVGGRPQPQLEEVTEIAWLSPAQLLAMSRPGHWTTLFQQAIHHLNTGHFVL